MKQECNNSWTGATDHLCWLTQHQLVQNSLGGFEMGRAWVLGVPDHGQGRALNIFSWSRMSPYSTDLLTYIYIYIYMYVRTSIYKMYVHMHIKVYNCNLLVQPSPRDKVNIHSCSPDYIDPGICAALPLVTGTEVVRAGGPPCRATSLDALA